MCSSDLRPRSNPSPVPQNSSHSREYRESVRESVRWVVHLRLQRGWRDIASSVEERERERESKTRQSSLAEAKEGWLVGIEIEIE